MTTLEYSSTPHCTVRDCHITNPIQTTVSVDEAY